MVLKWFTRNKTWSTVQRTRGSFCNFTLLESAACKCLPAVQICLMLQHQLTLLSQSSCNHIVSRQSRRHLTATTMQTTIWLRCHVGQHLKLPQGTTSLRKLQHSKNWSLTAHIWPSRDLNLTDTTSTLMVWSNLVEKMFETLQILNEDEGIFDRTPLHAGKRHIQEERTSAVSAVVPGWPRFLPGQDAHGGLNCNYSQKVGHSVPQMLTQRPRPSELPGWWWGLERRPGFWEQLEHLARHSSSNQTPESEDTTRKHTVNNSHKHSSHFKSIKGIKTWFCWCNDEKTENKGTFMGRKFHFCRAFVKKKLKNVL